MLLDIGCGPAAVPIMLSGSANSKIYCVDLSEDMVKIARRNAKPYKNVKIGFGSSRSIPFRMKFDIVYTSLSFHHWHEKAQSLNYMKGFLTKNGEIRIYEFKRDGSRLLGLLGLGCHTLDMPELRRISSQVGLEIAGVVYMGRYVRVSLTDKYKFLKKKIK
ncbi:MAG: class I SAM-dependent methyltransferase [Candidatus Micrarchaeota archaeon]|nr:class I SAM-dependent methyltransferase [Candidatus Micrarchaeota archaeon]